MPSKDRRREMRLTSNEEDLVLEAAGLLDVSFSEFVLNEAVSRASQVVESHHAIRITDSQARADFFASLDAPFTRNDRLVSQAYKSRRIKSSDPS